jgi:ankyrin repeat protein
MGYTVLHIAAAAAPAAAGGSHLVQLLLDAEADVNVNSAADKESPLHLAAEQGDVDIVRQLLAAGAAVDGARESSYATPLHYAAKYGQLSAARELLAAGADITAQASPPFLPPIRFMEDLTPLHLAAQHGHPEVVLLLLSGTHSATSYSADILSRALCDAIKHGNRSCSSLLIAAGALATADQRETAMLAAIGAKDTAAVQQLLDAGVSPEIKMWGNFPVLHEAVGRQCGDTAVLECLLAAGATVTAQDSYGMTALMHAVCCGEVSHVKLLLAAAEASGGAAAVKAAVNQGCKHGSTALHSAAWPGAAAAVTTLPLLLAAGADLDAAAEHKWTPLHEPGVVTWR